MLCGRTPPRHSFLLPRALAGLGRRPFDEDDGSRDTCELLCLNLPRPEALGQARADAVELDAAAERAKAFGDPTPLMIAQAPCDGEELCVCDLSWVCERSDKLVSHHVRQLRATGVVRSRRQGKMAMDALTPSGRSLLDAVTTPVATPA